MPFKSEAQRRYLYANEPAVAKRWEKETPKGKRLPKKVAKSSLLTAYTEGGKRLRGK
jgi:hypothetical protein